MKPIPSTTNGWISDLVGTGIAPVSKKPAVKLFHSQIVRNSLQENKKWQKRQIFLGMNIKMILKSGVKQAVLIENDYIIEQRKHNLNSVKKW